MRKLLFICAIGALTFTNCKKKEDPAPVYTNVPTGSGGTALPPSNTKKSATLTVDGKSQTFDVMIIDNSSSYALSGTTTKGSFSSFSATFLNGKPTTGQTIDFSSDQEELSVSLGNSSTHYVAISGTAVVTVKDGKVTVSFTDVTFISGKDNDAIIASGTISSEL